MTNLTLYVPCIVTNYVNKPTRCNFCMYLFYNFCKTLRVSKDHFVHHQGFMIYCICSSVQTMQTCLTAVRHVHSKHVELYINCRINTCRKSILLFCLRNKYNKGSGKYKTAIEAISSLWNPNCSQGNYNLQLVAA